MISQGGNTLLLAALAIARKKLIGSAVHTVKSVFINVCVRRSRNISVIGVKMLCDSTAILKKCASVSEIG